MLTRKLSVAVLAAAMLGTAALSSAVHAQDTISVSAGQGGFYSVPVYPRVESAPYALTGYERYVRNTPTVYQNYGQGQLVIPDVTGR